MEGDGKNCSRSVLYRTSTVAITVGLVADRAPPANPSYRWPDLRVHFKRCYVNGMLKPLWQQRNKACALRGEEYAKLAGDRSGCLPLQGSGWRSQQAKLASIGMAGPQTPRSWGDGQSPGASGSFVSMGSSCQGVQALFWAPVWFCWDFSMEWKGCCSEENANAKVAVGGEVQSPCAGAPCGPAQREDEQNHADTHSPSIRGSFHVALRPFMAHFPWFWFCVFGEVIGRSLLRRSLFVHKFADLWSKYWTRMKNKAVYNLGWSSQ